MNWLVYPISVLLVVIATALQNTWPGWLLLLGRGPDLVLATVVAVGLAGGPVLGCLAGLVAGMTMAASQSAMFGAFFFTYMTVGILVGLMRGTIFADRVLAAMLIVAVAGPLADMLRMVIAPPAAPQPWLLSTILAAPYSGLGTAPVYAVARAIVGAVSRER